MAGAGAVVVAVGLGFGGAKLLDQPSFCERAAELSQIDLNNADIPPVDSLREAADSYQELADTGGETEGAARLVAAYFHDLADAVEADEGAGPDDPLQAASVVSRAASDASLAESNDVLADAVEACAANP